MRSGVESIRQGLLQTPNSFIHRNGKIETVGWSTFKNRLNYGNTKLLLQLIAFFLVENDYYFSRMIIFVTEFRRGGWAKVNTIKKIND